MRAKAKKNEAAVIEIRRVAEEALTFCVVGISPFVCNAMSAKVRGDLLLPPQKKNAAEKATTLKHDPMVEYRRSIYRSLGNGAETRIEFPAGGWKRAMASAALELPGVRKTQIGRLCWVEGHMLPIFGVPQIYMAVVRSADIGRTPDVRTRAILPEWAARVPVKFVTPNLKRQSVANLLASAGVFIGVGDGRPEKGALSFGRFDIVDEDDERFLRIVTEGGREAQDAALEEPEAFDVETEELLEWWTAEAHRRGFEVA